jgi:rhodanese-related sulfurtransferase
MEEPMTEKFVSPEELASRLESDAPPIVIDTHVEARYERVHLPGARNARVLEVAFLDQVRGITEDLDAPIVVYGSRAETSDGPMAAEKLTRAGYTDVAILRGGLAAWREAGLPLDGGATDEVPAATLPDGEFSVDVEASVVEWAGRNPNTTHFGTVPLTRGDLAVRDGVLSGEFEVDLTRIENESLAGNDLKPVLIAHLESDDFFFAKLFPKAAFTLSEGVPVEGATATSPNYDVRGRLALRGVTADLDFPATLNRRDDGALVAEAHFDIDRTRWNIVYGSARFFDHLGMHLVFDLISFRIRLVAGS